LHYESVSSTYTVAVAIRPPRGPWGTPLMVGVPDTYPPNGLDVAVDGKGRVYVVWAEYNSGTTTYTLNARIRTGSTWSTTEPLSLVGVNATSPSVDANQAGQAMVAFAEGNSPNINMESSYRPVNGPW